MKIIIRITCGALLLLPVLAPAQQRFGLTSPTSDDLYLSAFLDRQSLGLNGTTEQLRPIVATAVIGYWILPGVGLEFEAGTSLSEDKIGTTLDVDSTSIVGLSLRLESSTTMRYAAYTQFSYVRSAYDTQDGGISASLSLPGGRMALGLTYRLSQQFVLDASFTHHNYDEETRINSFRFGARFDLGTDR